MNEMQVENALRLSSEGCDCASEEGTVHRDSDSAGGDYNHCDAEQEIEESQVAVAASDSDSEGITECEGGKAVL